MNPFHALFPEKLYHSYIVEGDPTETVPILREYLTSRGDIGETTDMLYQTYTSLALDDVTSVKEWHTTKGEEGSKRICILSMHFLNVEAEQSLLKILEEPHTHTHFFIIVPRISLLKDTILSRAHIVSTQIVVQSFFEDFTTQFISSRPADRLLLVADFIKKYTTDESSCALRSSAVQFVNELERKMYALFTKDKTNTQIHSILDELQKGRMYMETPGASVKMILEHIALVL